MKKKLQNWLQQYFHREEPADAMRLHIKKLEKDIEQMHRHLGKTRATVTQCSGE